MERLAAWKTRRFQIRVVQDAYRNAAINILNLGIARHSIESLGNRISEWFGAACAAEFEANLRASAMTVA